MREAPVKILLRIPRRNVRLLDAIAESKELPRSVVIREALQEYVQREVNQQAAR